MAIAMEIVDQAEVWSSDDEYLYTTVFTTDQNRKMYHASVGCRVAQMHLSDIRPHMQEIPLNHIYPHCPEGLQSSADKLISRSSSKDHDCCHTVNRKVGSQSLMP